MRGHLRQKTQWNVSDMSLKFSETRATMPYVGGPKPIKPLIWLVADQFIAIKRGYFVERANDNHARVLPLIGSAFKTDREIITAEMIRARAGDPHAFKMIMFVKQQDEHKLKLAWERPAIEACLKPPHKMRWLKIFAERNDQERNPAIPKRKLPTPRVPSGYAVPRPKRAPRAAPKPSLDYADREPRKRGRPYGSREARAQAKHRAWLEWSAVNGSDRIGWQRYIRQHGIAWVLASEFAPVTKQPPTPEQRIANRAAGLAKVAERKRLEHAERRDLQIEQWQTYGGDTPYLEWIKTQGYQP
jgi:hypothetical protein